MLNYDFLRIPIFFLICKFVVVANLILSNKVELLFFTFDRVLDLTLFMVYLQKCLTPFFIPVYFCVLFIEIDGKYHFRLGTESF